MTDRSASGDRPASGDGLLRALQAEARRAERQRMLDALEAAEVAAWQEARKTRSPRPGLTVKGRRAAAMRTAYEELTQHEHKTNASITNAGEFASRVINACDSIELYYFDPTDESEPEEFPVRLVLIDGAESVTGSAYLSLEDAEEHARAVLVLVEQLRTRRGRRAAVRADRGERPPAAAGGPCVVVADQCGPGTVCPEFWRSGSAHTEVCCDIAVDPRAT